MKKKTINEEIKRMQILAGIIKEDDGMEETTVKEGIGQKVKASSISSPEFQALMNFVDERVGDQFPLPLQDSLIEVVNEESAFIDASRDSRIGLVFTQEGTHVDPPGNKMYFFKGYTIDNFRTDFGVEGEMAEGEEGAMTKTYNISDIDFKDEGNKPISIDDVFPDTVSEEDLEAYREGEVREIYVNRWEEGEWGIYKLPSGEYMYASPGGEYYAKTLPGVRIVNDVDDDDDFMDPAGGRGLHSHI